MKTPQQHASISIDFTRHAGPPISHDRIALFNSGLVTEATYRRDAEFFDRTHPEHLRIDLGWGAEWMPWTAELATKVGGEYTYDFDETDAIARFLHSHGVRPYWSYCYVPKALRQSGSDWRTMANDNGPWVDMVREYVAGATSRGVSIGYHEVYNEPDLRDERTGEPVFYAGDLDDYLELYRATSLAIREADPTARIGGPALASVAANAAWIPRFLDFVVTESLPLDFLSFHHYGAFSLEPAIERVLRELDARPQLSATELHLNEYNSFTIDYPRGGVQDSFYLASAFARDVDRLLGWERLTRVSWAQFLDSGNDNFSGMVDIDGKPKPLFAAYEFLQGMPHDRYALAAEGPEGVGGFASATDRRRAAMIWNRSTVDVEIELEVLGAVGSWSGMTIDGTGAHSVARLTDGSIGLARGALLCIESGGSAPEPPTRVVLRTRYDFTDVAASRWVDVDEATGDVRFATGDSLAPLRIGLDLPEGIAPEFEFRVEHDDGRIASGKLSVESSATHGFVTHWLTLADAPAGVFAKATLVGSKELR
jgi:hypothetical protein